MEKLERKTKKHDHKLTHILKATIFSIVMLAPLIAVGVKCLYTLNPNAKESYSDNTSITEYTQIDKSNMIFQHTYTFIKDADTTIEGQLQITCDAIKLYKNDGQETDVREYHKISIGTQQITLQQNGMSTIYAPYTNGYYRVDFIYFTTVTDTLVVNNGFYEIITTNKATNLDNAFYYSIDQIKEEPIFNWAENTGIYTAIDNMVTGLGANDVISLLLAYWSIITAIYIVFDIVIELFVKITHMINAD